MKVWVMSGLIICLVAVAQAGEETKSAKAATPKDMTKEEFVAMEKAKWTEKGWRWNQAKVEANFDVMDTNKDGLASGKERKLWYEKKAAEIAAMTAQKK